MTKSGRFRPIRLAIAMTLAVTTVFIAPSSPVNAAYETGAYEIASPVVDNVFVTSPPRYHDGCEPYTSSYYDSPAFDNLSTCHPAANGDWSMDLSESTVGSNVYIDIFPSAIDGWPAGSLYEVVAGDVYHWDSSANGSYQYFGIHTWNPTTSSWENYAWIVLGHVDNFRYSVNQVIAGPTYGQTVVQVAQVAPRGTWPVHVHLELYNYSGYSRSFN